MLLVEACHLLPHINLLFSFQLYSAGCGEDSLMQVWDVLWSSGDRWGDDTPVCSSPQSDLIILCRNTDPKLCEVIFIADIQKLFHFLWYTRVALDDSVILSYNYQFSPFRDKSVQVHSYNLNLSLPICHSPKIYYLSNIYQILSHSFCSFWPMIQRSLFIYLKRSSKKEF